MSPLPIRRRLVMAGRGLAAVLLLALWGCSSGSPVTRPHSGNPPRRDPGPPAAVPDERMPAPGPGATLADLRAYALHASPRLRAAFENWRAALARIPQVGSLPDPRITFAWYVRSVETRVGPMERRYAVQQALPWFGKLALREDIAASAAEVERQKVERVRLDLVREVELAWLDLLDLAKTTEIVRENLRLLEVWESVVRSRYETATAEHPDLIRIQIERSRQEDRLRGLIDRRTVVAARLNAALGLEPDAAVPTPGDLPGRTLPPDPTTLRGELALGNPELRALEIEARRHGQAAELAEKGVYPDVTLGIEYVEIGDAIMETRDDGKDAIAAVISIGVPLDRDRIRASATEARRRRGAALARHEDLQRRLEADLERALYEVREADRQIGLYRDELIPKSREWIDSTVALYQSGRAPLDDLIAAWRSSLEFQIQFERALVRREKGIVEVEAITGGGMDGEEGGKRP